MRFPPPLSPFLAAALLVPAVAFSGGSPAAAVPSQTGPAAQAPATAGEGAGDRVRYLVRFAPRADVAAEVKALRSRDIGVERTFSTVVRAAVVSATPGQAAALARSAGVAAVEVDAPVTITETQSAPPWGLDRIDQRALPLSNAYTFPGAGAGVSAYVIDTGVLAAHADFGGRVGAGWSAVADGLGSGDCNGHGTHVAGTVAGTIHGAAKAATVIPVRVLDCNGSGYTSDVVAGLDWAAAHHPAGVPAVANLSLGGGLSSTVDAAVEGLIADGVTTVVAAGNSAADACGSSPARVPGALTVAASDSADGQASFSNFGTCVDLYAPGVNIVSTWHTSTTATAALSGTSMAAPHTAGAAAVLLSRNPVMTPAQIGSAVLNSATTGMVALSSAGTPNRLLYSEPRIDLAAPGVSGRTPGVNARAVSVTGNLTATFTEAVQGVGAASFILKDSAGAAVPAAVSYNAATRAAVLNPASNLAADRRYSVTLLGGPAGIRDAAGNALAGTTWSFTTGPAPTITARIPAVNAVGVKRAANVAATFSEAVQGAGTGTFTLRNAATGAPVAATVSRYGSTNQWIFNPGATLAANTRYTVTVVGSTTAVRDLAGNPLARSSWTFTTGAL